MDPILASTVAFVDANRVATLTHTPEPVGHVDEIIHGNTLPFLNIGSLTAADLALVAADLEAVRDLLAPHGGERLGAEWTTVDLIHHGALTVAGERCSNTMEVLDRTFPMTVYSRVRFIRIGPGGYVAPGAEDVLFKLSHVTIPVSYPEGCVFVQAGHGPVPFAPGSAFLVNAAYAHALLNESDQERVHLVVQGAMAPALLSTVSQSYASLSG